MSASRAAACARLIAVRNAIAAFNLHDLPLIPANSSHNDSVRIIRNGLAVQCFNILEDFVKARTAEVLGDISASSVTFRFLPEDLQIACTVDAIRALDFQMRLRDKIDRMPYAQQHTASIASTISSPMTLADIAFFHAASNIGKDQFRDALSAFGIQAPWQQVSGLSSRLGLSGLPADSVFTSLAQRRHRAAHNAAMAVSEADLAQSVTDAFALGICFDILITKASEVLKVLTAVPPASFRTIPDHRPIPLRMIRAVAGRFAEQKEGAARSTRIGHTWSALLPAAENRARKERGALVVFDSGGGVAYWTV